MRILTTCASRNSTDLLSVAMNASSEDDVNINEIGNYLYDILRTEWIEAPHQDVGDRRENMIEHHKNNYRARVKLEVKYRESRLFLNLCIDRMPKNVDTPFGQKTLDFANEIMKYLFDGVCCIIYKNPEMLQACVFQCNEERIYDNGKWHTAADAILSKLHEKDSAAGDNRGQGDQRMRGELPEVEGSTGEAGNDEVRTLA